MAKLGLDVHNRGIIIVCRQLMDAGMEVIYMGNSFPDIIAETAIQEDVDAVGVSCLSGAHLALGEKLIDNMSIDITVAIGGVFPPLDVRLLKRMGFDLVFTPGATGEEIIKFLKECITIKGEFYGRRCTSDNC